MILALLDTAVKAGASRARACATIGLSLRSVQRWDKPGADDDGRSGPRKRPSNALTEHERRLVLGIVNSPGFCELSPKQIVPRLADEGRYLASESTIYRMLRAEDQLVHRGPNIKLSAWGRYLGDPTLAVAILDRATMHAVRLDINGPSYRQHVAEERAKKRGTKLPDDRADPEDEPKPRR